jgi:hypothetical protein
MDGDACVRPCLSRSRNQSPERDCRFQRATSRHPVSNCTYMSFTGDMPVLRLFEHLVIPYSNRQHIYWLPIEINSNKCWPIFFKVTTPLRASPTERPKQTRWAVRFRPFGWPSGRADEARVRAFVWVMRCAQRSRNGSRCPMVCFCL